MVNEITVDLTNATRPLQVAFLYYMSHMIYEGKYFLYNSVTFEPQYRYRSELPYYIEGGMACLYAVYFGGEEESKKFRSLPHDAMIKYESQEPTFYEPKVIWVKSTNFSN
jgi:hypothetical protein